MPDQPQVQIGSSTHTLEEFIAFKAVYAGEIVAGASAQIQQLLAKVAQFNRDYRKENVVRITRGTAAMRGYEIPEAAWNADGYIELPDSPDQMEIIGFIFPEAFKLARNEVLKLLALALISDNDLQEAEGGGQLDSALLDRGKRLLFQATLGQLINLTGVVTEMVQDTFDEQAEALGKIRSALQRARPNRVEEQPTELTPATVTPAPGASSPPSSTPSPEPTDGTGTESPSEPAIATS